MAGLSSGIGMPIAAPAVHGLAGSAMMPATRSLIAANFDKGERGEARCARGAVSGLAVVAGPLIGGALAQGGLGSAVIPKSRDEKTPLMADPLILALAILSGAIFLRRESRKGDPLLEAGLFKDPIFAGGSFVTAALQFAIIGTFFLMPFFLKTVIGLDSFKAGLAMIPMALLRVGIGLPISPTTRRWQNTRGD